MGHSKSSSRKEVYSDPSHLKKQEKSQISNLIYNLIEMSVFKGLKVHGVGLGVYYSWSERQSQLTPPLKEKRMT